MSPYTSGRDPDIHRPVSALGQPEHIDHCAEQSYNRCHNEHAVGFTSLFKR